MDHREGEVKDALLRAVHGRQPFLVNGLNSQQPQTSAHAGAEILGLVKCEGDGYVMFVTRREKREKPPFIVIEQLGFIHEHEVVSLPLSLPEEPKRRAQMP